MTEGKKKKLGQKINQNRKSGCRAIVDGVEKEGIKEMMDQIWQGIPKCKGPEAGLRSAYWKNSLEASLRVC